MRIWEYELHNGETVVVQELKINYDLNVYAIEREGRFVALISPPDLEAQASLIDDLDNLSDAEELETWEDGRGNPISLDGSPEGSEEWAALVEQLEREVGQ